MAKRAVCISCFDFYDHRVELVMDQLRQRGYECTYITGDFSHFTREKYKIDVPGGEQVPTIPYHKNMSVMRLVSHQAFTRAVFKRVRQLKPDLLYVMTPPNSLCKEAGKYKQRHPETTFAVDLYDLWPETFPSHGAKKILALPFALWQAERDLGLKHADIVYTECDLYRQVLHKQLRGKRVYTLPICRERVTCGPHPQAPEGEALSLCYLGTIGKLLDIDVVEELLRQMAVRRPVKLHIIGEGENREELIQRATTAGAEVIYHGRIYDPDKRQKIFDQCHFGINIMKTSVLVGLTMKSLDYFAGGLPVLNTIEGDTRSRVSFYQAGIEVDRGDLVQTARRAARMTNEENTRMRLNTLKLFENNYSIQHVRDILSDLG